jgi:hypothetical protein
MPLGDEVLVSYLDPGIKWPKKKKEKRKTNFERFNRGGGGVEIR